MNAEIIPIIDRKLFERLPTDLVAILIVSGFIPRNNHMARIELMYRKRERMEERLIPPPTPPESA